MMELRNRSGAVFQFVVDQSARFPLKMPSMLVTTAHRNKYSFKPAVEICTLNPEESGPSSPVFKEIDAEFPNGLTFVKSTELVPKLSVLVLTKQRNLDPEIYPSFFNFPLTGSR